MGAQPAAVVDRVRELGWPGVVGNTDEVLWRPEEQARPYDVAADGRREQGAHQTGAWKFALLEQEADDLRGALHLGFDREQRVVVDEPLGNADDGVGERVGVDPGVEGPGLYLFAVELGVLRDGA